VEFVAIGKDRGGKEYRTDEQGMMNVEVFEFAVCGSMFDVEVSCACSFNLWQSG
jgi:hypothetical protein